MKNTSMKTINILTLSLFILLAPGQIFSQQNGGTEIAPNSVVAALVEGAIFVDVREANEVAILAYDVPGVINLPLSELPDRLAELPLDQPIVLACRSGKRSVQAANLLTLNNFSEVSSLAGGIIAWEAAGLPVQEKDRSTEATPFC
jgi:rhodanese-related sulfurtransferase